MSWRRAAPAAPRRFVGSPATDPPRDGRTARLQAHSLTPRSPEGARAVGTAPLRAPCLAESAPRVATALRYTRLRERPPSRSQPVSPPLGRCGSAGPVFGAPHAAHVRHRAQLHRTDPEAEIAGLPVGSRLNTRTPDPRPARRSGALLRDRSARSAPAPRRHRRDSAPASLLPAQHPTPARSQPSVRHWATAAALARWIGALHDSHVRRRAQLRLSSPEAECPRLPLAVGSTAGLQTNAPVARARPTAAAPLSALADSRPFHLRLRPPTRSLPPFSQPPGTQTPPARSRTEP